jgi:hypothetical protein
MFDSLNQEEHFKASIIELTQFNTIIICVYRTPNSNVNIFLENMDTINYYKLLIYKGKSIIIVGDLNIDFLGRSVNLQLKTMLNSYGLQAIVDIPTRIGPKSQTAIDQILLNKCLWGYKFKVIATGYSDHYVQILKVQMQHKNKKRQAIVNEEFRTVRSCREENVQYLNYLLEKEAWEHVFKEIST